MKNLLIYINPRKDFGNEEKITVKIQIDNSLDLGWKNEDILLVTNFPYEYNGIKAIVVGDENYCPYEPLSTKAYTLPNLFKNNFFEKGELYWSHDLDVFQNEPISGSELELGETDIGLTDKGRMPKWNMGSLFFKSGSNDIFNCIKAICDKYKTDEENAIWILCGHDVYLDADQTNLVEGYTGKDIPGLTNMQSRIKKINITYNLRKWNIDSTYAMAVKPIRAVQFHPLIENDLDFFVRGMNKINKVLIPERLIKIFHKYGIK